MSATNVDMRAGDTRGIASTSLSNRSSLRSLVSPNCDRSLDVSAPKLLLAQEAIVLRTKQPQIFERVRPAARPSSLVMNL